MTFKKCICGNDIGKVHHKRCNRCWNKEHGIKIKKKNKKEIQMI